MLNAGRKKEDDISEIDLLSCSSLTSKWIPKFMYGSSCWKVMSGEWDVRKPNTIVFRKDAEVKTGENYSIIGPSTWSDYILNVKVRVLSDSLKPPEGGALIYYRFKNVKNNYSVHICIAKKRIEIIKRYRGNWSTIAGQDFDVETMKEYDIGITAHESVHQLQINGKKQMEIIDNDILSGCVGLGMKYCDVEYSRALVSII